jgi:hypothetical protein
MPGNGPSLGERMHKFKVGQIVRFHPDRAELLLAPPGPYQVTKQLPLSGSELEYRIRSPNEEHERIARESQLSQF